MYVKSPADSKNVIDLILPSIISSDLASYTSMFTISKAQ